MARGDAEQRGGTLDPTLMVEQLNRPTGEARRRRFDRSRREYAGDALDELRCVVDRNQLVAQARPRDPQSSSSVTYRSTSSLIDTPRTDPAQPGLSSTSTARTTPVAVLNRARVRGPITQASPLPSSIVRTTSVVLPSGRLSIRCGMPATACMIRTSATRLCTPAL